jgi:16S rRNA (cytosine1402-N4)-methyltransferase
MHIPVLQKEVLEYLSPKPNQNFIDCTIGEGGHSAAILERIAPRGKILGIDRDPDILKAAKLKIKNEKLKNNLILVCGNFADLKEIVHKNKFKSVSGILFDLGMSSWHLEESGRGFSFNRREPLDMRYSLQNPLTAEKILNYWSKSELEKILREYGEERRSRKIAEKIAEVRKVKPIKNTVQLREIVEKAGSSPRKTFQALRIAVNDELENLKKALPQAVDILEKGGRLVVISFHSLEDRIVKNYFKEKAKGGLPIVKILTKKPITPSPEEIKQNPRSRSAKLRAICKVKVNPLS